MIFTNIRKLVLYSLFLGFTILLSPKFALADVTKVEVLTPTISGQVPSSSDSARLSANITLTEKITVDKPTPICQISVEMVPDLNGPVGPNDSDKFVLYDANSTTNCPSFSTANTNPITKKFTHLAYGNNKFTVSVSYLNSSRNYVKTASAPLSFTIAGTGATGTGGTGGTGSSGTGTTGTGTTGSGTTGTGSTGSGATTGTTVTGSNGSNNFATLPTNTSISDRLKEPVVTTIWKVSLGLADTVVVLLFIAIAFATIMHINYDVYGVKKAIWPLIIGIIMAHFSLLIIRNIVDFSQILGAGFFNAASGNAGARGLATNLAQTFISGGIGSLSNAITSQGGYSVGATTALLAGVTYFFTLPTTSFVGLIIAIVVLLIPIIFVIILAFMLYVRAYMIIVLTMLAPLAFLCQAWSPLQGIFKNWWQQFIRWVFMGPAVLFLLWIAIMVHRVSTNTAGTSSSTATSASFFTYILTILMMYLAIKIPFSWGGAVGNFIQNQAKQHRSQAIGATNTGLGRFMDKNMGGSIATRRAMYKKVSDDNYEKVKAKVDNVNQQRFEKGLLKRAPVWQQLRHLSAKNRSQDAIKDIKEADRGRRFEQENISKTYDKLKDADPVKLQEILDNKTATQYDRAAAAQALINRGIGDTDAQIETMDSVGSKEFKTAFQAQVLPDLAKYNPHLIKDDTVRSTAIKHFVADINNLDRRDDLFGVAPGGPIATMNTAASAAIGTGKKAALIAHLGGGTRPEQIAKGEKMYAMYEKMTDERYVKNYFRSGKLTIGSPLAQLLSHIQEAEGRPATLIEERDPTGGGRRTVRWT